MVSLSCVASFKAFCNTNVTVSFPLFLLVSTRHLPIQQTAAPPNRIAPPFNAWYVRTIAEVNRRKTVSENVSVAYKDEGGQVTRGLMCAEAQTYGADRLWVVLKPIAIELESDMEGSSSGSPSSSHESSDSDGDGDGAAASSSSQPPPKKQKRKS